MTATARGVAILRAAHQVIDGVPKILDDPVIARLLGPDTDARLRAEPPERFSPPLARGLRSHIVLRNRFAEDALEAAAKNGTRQYVLLGAGLDTFAYRQPAWARTLTIVEVDQPSTQQEKRAMLATAAIAVPANVRYADVDFERETLAAGLARCGIGTTERTMFSWLGVTMYLTREAIVAVLRTVASFPAGSAIALTFAQPHGEDSGQAWIAERAAEMGEPWISLFTPAELRAMVLESGFSSVEYLERDEATRRYYGSRTDGLEAPQRTSIAIARV